MLRFLQLPIPFPRKKKIVLLATWVTYGIESYNHGIELRYDEIELCFSWDRILLPFQWELFAPWITHGMACAFITHRIPKMPM